MIPVVMKNAVVSATLLALAVLWLGLADRLATMVAGSALLVLHGSVAVLFGMGGALLLSGPKWLRALIPPVGLALAGIGSLYLHLTETGYESVMTYYISLMAPAVLLGSVIGTFLLRRQGNVAATLR